MPSRRYKSIGFFFYLSVDNQAKFSGRKECNSCIIKGIEPYRNGRTKTKIHSTF